MLRSLLSAAMAISLATPLVAQSDSVESPTTGRGYTSFILRVPYAFDLPAKFRTAWINCSIRDTARSEPGLSVTAQVDLVTSSSGELVLGFDDGGDISFTEGGQLAPEQARLLRDMIANELFELEATCGTTGLLSADDQQYGILQFGDGRWGPVLGYDPNAQPAAWMTDDYEPQVSRTFNQSENEAFGAFDSGAIPNAVSGQVTTTQGDGTGLSTLDRLLKP